MRLLHRTCDHGKRRIEADMMLYAPNVAYRGLIWLSDLPNPTPAEIGLTSYILNCNRMEWVCEVCGTQVRGERPPASCPTCAADTVRFVHQPQPPGA